MKHKITFVFTVAIVAALTLAACSSTESTSLGRDKVNGGELMSRSDSQDYITSLLDNNTYIDLDPNVPASLGDFSRMDSIGAKYRVVLYRIYSATKIQDGLFKIDATPSQLSMSPRIFEKYRKMLEESGNADLVKYRAEGNDEAIRQIMRQFTPEAIESVIRPTN